MVARQANGREEPAPARRQVRRQVSRVGAQQGSNDDVFRHALARSNGGA